MHITEAFLRRDDERGDPLPPQLPDPQPRGTAGVQVLRTYPAKIPRFPFAHLGERSIARGYDKAVRRATSLVFIEDQYFWSGEVVSCFAKALAANPGLHMLIVLPSHPSQAGRLSQASTTVSRAQALADVRRAGGTRVGVYSLENRAGVPVYVHAKVCVVDDVWATIGSDNVNRRSWTHDSELTCAVYDHARDERHPRVLDAFGDGARVFARELRLRLAREHLDRDDGDDGDDADLVDPLGAFRAFAYSAARLQGWHEGGRRGPRPPGRLRPYTPPEFSGIGKVLAETVYRVADDPDGRPTAMHWAGRF